MPTVDQAIAYVRVFQMFSNGYQSIHMFRYNANTNTVLLESLLFRHKEI
ncbi:DUF6888 family protein [Pseudanabaena yagii]|uniref:DUF6888 domain-containing protein n=1 Tax=Pseudanabaena yagii GIHE-NHR1 TaxID=2722753 RepID=A0ABX1LRY6_9CYAN|nr:hypothetical protein [Pseudanabaena yagii]NMF58078.1 hypothetical protein [Pseudanabaena yagii GIHE-NHR1]